MGRDTPEAHSDPEPKVWSGWGDAKGLTLSPRDRPHPSAFTRPEPSPGGTSGSGLGTGRRERGLYQGLLLAQGQRGIEKMGQAVGRRGYEGSLATGAARMPIREPVLPGDACARRGPIPHEQGKPICRREKERALLAVSLPEQLHVAPRPCVSGPPTASGHEVQWGDFVISSQGSLKGPAPLLGVNGYLLDNQQPQMSMCTRMGGRR